MKYLFILALSLSLHMFSFAQEILSELYNYNYAFVNPAFIGKMHQTGFLMNYNRNNNSGFISSGILFYERPIEKINSGIGIIAYGESLGPSSMSSYGALFNHQFFSKKKVQLKIGTKIYYQKISVDFDAYQVTQPSDPLLNSDGYEKSTAAKMDLGAIVKFKSLYAAIALNNIFDARPTSKSGIAYYSPKTERVINVTLGIDHKFSDKISSSHSIYTATQDGELKFVDLNNSITAFNWFVLGLSYHISDDSAWRVSTGFKIKNYAELMLLVYSNDYKDYKPDFKAEALLTVKL